MKLLQKAQKRRLLFWLLGAIALLAIIAILAPQQLPITIYKLSLVLLAAVIGYHLDRALFPYASPGSYLQYDWKKDGPNDDDGAVEYPVVKGYEHIFAIVLIRRALIVTAVILGVTLGL